MLDGNKANSFEDEMRVKRCLYIEEALKQKTKASYEAFVSTFKVLPNLVFCSQALLEYVACKHSVTYIDGFNYWNGCQVYFISQNIMLWFLVGSYPSTCNNSTSYSYDNDFYFKDIDQDLIEETMEEYDRL